MTQEIFIFTLTIFNHSLFTSRRHEETQRSADRVWSCSKTIYHRPEGQAFPLLSYSSLVVVHLSWAALTESSFLKKYLFIHLALKLGFVVGPSFSTQDLHCVLWGLSLWCRDSLVVVCGLGLLRSMWDPSPNLCPLHCKVDSQPPDLQGSPRGSLLSRDLTSYIHLAGSCSVLKNKSVPVIYIPCDILRNSQEAPPSVHVGFPPLLFKTPFFSDSDPLDVHLHVSDPLNMSLEEWTTVLQVQVSLTWDTTNY